VLKYYEYISYVSALSCLHYIYINLMKSEGWPSTTPFSPDPHCGGRGVTDKKSTSFS